MGKGLIQRRSGLGFRRPKVRPPKVGRRRQSVQEAINSKS